jgi:hypothetical protein
MAQRLGVSGARAGLARLSLADFGLVEGTRDAEAAFREALAQLPAAGGNIVVPPGTWRFARTEGAAIQVSGRDNVTIEGFGATLMFVGVTRPFVFDSCSAPTVQGITIDWERPPFSQGEVIAVAANGRMAEVRLDAAFHVDGSESIEAFQTMEPGTFLMARKGLDIFGSVESSELIAAQTLRLSFARPVMLRNGDAVILRHKVGEAHLITFSRCNDLKVEDVTLQSGPGIGILAGGCEGGTVRRLQITPPKNSSRLMTITADGVHFSSCRGKVVIEDSVMLGMGDDGVNVHGRYYAITQVIDPRTLRVDAPRGTRFGALKTSPEGDVMEIVGHEYNSLAQANVTGARSERVDTVLSFRQDLPLSLEVGSLVFDVETDTNTWVSNCKFPGNRGRGVLVHANSTIQKCEFHGQALSAILMDVDPFYLEGPVISDVNVINNTIDGVSRISNDGAIKIEASIKIRNQFLSIVEIEVNHDVYIGGNLLSNCLSPAITAANLYQAEIVGNRIESSYLYAVGLSICSNIKISSNSFLQNGKVLLSKTAKDSIITANNTGMEPLL